MVTASDVAKRAGVSQSTVSYVMSGTRSISPETKARVESAIQELGYHPNAGARALAGRRTNVIGLMARLPSNENVAALLPFIDTISGYCRERDYDLVLVTEDQGPAGLERLAGRAIADAIVLMDIRRNDDRVATARALNVPVVLIGVPDDARDLDCVDFDVTRAGALAVDELLATDHDRIILIGEPPSVQGQEFGFVEQFTRGARDAAASKARFEIYEPASDGWPGFDVFQTLASSFRDERVGVIARTPQAIDMAMQILDGEGLLPGRDVSIVGMCTDATAESFRRPVTNVSPEPRDVSRLAMETLFARLNGNGSETRVRLVTPRLTRRATTTAITAP